MKLKKELNLLDVFCIASGAMISSGIFLLPGIAHAQTGPAVVISYFLAGLLAMSGMISMAETATAMPKAGGGYFFVTRSLGPAIGTTAGILNWFSISLKSAFALIGMAAFTRLFINLNPQVIAVIYCLLFILLNLIGVKEASRIQIVMVASLLILMVFYIGKGFPAVKMHRFVPFAPQGWRIMFSTAGFIFISYGGLLEVVSVAEEIKDPGRVIPLGMALSLLVVSVLYTLMVFVTSGVLDAQILHHSLTPISDGARIFLGEGGAMAMGIAAFLAFVTTANAGLMSSARYPLALSRDGLLPGFLGLINSRFKTPHIAVLLTGILMLLTLFLRLEVLVEAASTVVILTNILSCVSIIVLREGRVQNYQPTFQAPLYPWLQIIGLISYGLLILQMGRESLLISLILVTGGLLIFFVYGRKGNKNREYALLHLIERITAKELTSGSLDAELREIIRDRDNLIQDRFDRVIEEGIVLDFEQPLSVNEFFALVSKYLSEKVHVSSAILEKKLLEKEREISSVIGPNLAIPHLIIDGEHSFQICMARCRPGILFPGSSSRVQAVFALIGTRDERNLHLRALSALAQIVLNPQFEKKWLQAKNEEDLRDIILLGKRRREK